MNELKHFQPVNEQQTSPEADRTYTQLLGWSYLAYVFELHFFSFLLAWICRRNERVHHDLVSSALFQLPFSLITIGLFVFSTWDLFLSESRAFMPLMQIIFGTLVIAWSLLSKVVFLILSWKAFQGESLSLWGVSRLSQRFIEFFKVKKLKRAFFLNLLAPGLGQIYLGRPWLGLVIVVSFWFTLSIFAFLLLASYKVHIAQILLARFGFYLRASDEMLQQDLSSPLSLIIWGGAALLIYLTGLLLAWRPLDRRGRRVFGSFGMSYLIHLSLICVLFMIPYVFAKSDLKESINKRAEEIYKELQKEKKKKEKPKNNKLEKLQERELKFDLIMTEQVDGLNEFKPRPFAPRSYKDKNRPQISYAERRQRVIPDRETALENSRQTKSYSEYLTAKIREDSRDETIWEHAEDNPYSMVVEYIVEGNGYISEINIIESSESLETDALVVAVLESMNPLITTPNGQRLEVVELFWNTGLSDVLPTKLQNELKSYPDGRVISIERD